MTTQDLEDARKHRFLYHLADIRMLDDRIDEELLQYIRFNKEKLRLMVNGSVDPSESTARGDRLIERWKYSSDKHKIEAAEKDPCDIGMLIFLSAAEQREPLDGNDMPEGYMTSGHYHRLADDDLVYWNPSFKASKGTS